MNTAKAWQLTAWNQIECVDVPVAEPGPGEVRLRMRAASINYRDVMTVRGEYNPRQPLPLVPFSDGVGVVDAVGPDVRRVKVGDRVTPIFCQSWLGGRPTRERLRSSLGGPLDGTLREVMVCPAESVVRVPAHLSDAQAAALPCAGLTAWSALVTLGQLTPGSTVLLQGTGGVSIFALQFAKALGHTAIITSSSDAKLERCRALGADHAINYRTTPAWGREARALTGKRGVDLVVEVGGAGTLEQSLAAVAIGGTVAVIGVLGGAATTMSVVPLLMQQVRMQGLLVGHRDGHEAMCRAIDAWSLEPVIDRVFPVDAVSEALDHVAEGRHFGKVALAITSGEETER